MKILVLANITPFQPGGADYHIEGLVHHLRVFGHEVGSLRLPFNFASYPQIQSLMDFCEQQDFNYFNGELIDRVISLQFPAWGASHNEHSSWIMHQHRVAYELYEQQPGSVELDSFRDKIIEFDNRALKKVKRLFSNSRTVANRLERFNGLAAEPLYHPPFAADRFYCEPSYDYVFYPSRFESLKRQELLIEAARYLETPVKLILSGVGGRLDHCRALVEQYDLGERVRLTGRISEEQKLAYYARALAVYFGPFDEDYGYVTLEAMLSAKAVLTTNDAGGPLEFVTDGDNGFVAPPEPRAIAAAIDDIYRNKSRTREMGQRGRELYTQKEITWQRVIETLLA
ncbi:MAG TPA: glycosyl transferase [Porticoccaceae bacterium]|nr:glycosyl transferase [Porticoccaceae bacterium]